MHIDDAAGDPEAEPRPTYRDRRPWLWRMVWEWEWEWMHLTSSLQLVPIELREFSEYLVVVLLGDSRPRVRHLHP